MDASASVVAVHPRRVAILVQNLPVPLDRRVWNEATSLVAAGHSVSVVAHRGPGQPLREDLDGVHVYRYPPPPQARGVLGYGIEFAWCWLFSLVICLWLRLTRGMDVIHACNPPDTFWMIGRLMRPMGVRFIYDQHDLCPELFAAKFGADNEDGRLARALRWLELNTYRTASAVISTNASYRSVAQRRGGLDPAASFIVRSAPSRDRLTPGPALQAHRYGHDEVIGYIGIMGSQDGVDHLLHALHELVIVRGRTGLGAVLVGAGDELARMRELAVELGLAEHAHFLGRINDIAEIEAVLRSTDVGLCPDPPTPFNDVSSMNKIVEYMALGKPVIGYQLTESRFTMGSDVGLVGGDNPVDLAAEIERQLNDPAGRATAGAANRARFEEQLSWETQVPVLIDAYDSLGPSKWSPQP